MAGTTGKVARRSKKTKAKSASSGRSPRAKAGEGRKLVIVESPAKAKTINRYLGNKYIVRASMGHIRDLPSKNPKGVKDPVPGVDLDHDFAPTYLPLTGREKVLTELRKYARGAPEIFLATDLDREGEAIAWHLAESLGVPAGRFRRVIFNEITAGAIREAFANPRSLDMDRVNAQQARRIMDRIVGYQVSPLLWRKVSAGLSAGRVQSVAVRLIVDREREIDAFMPQEYWKIGGVFTPDCDASADLAVQWRRFLDQTDEKGQPPTQVQQQEFLSARGAFRAELVKWKGKRFKADAADAALEVARALGLSVEVTRRDDPAGKGPAAHLVEVRTSLAEGVPAFSVRSLNQRDSRSRPPAPLTTATMQQTASVQLRFAAGRTMRIAQQLYEGVEIPGEGGVGLITYMRTDSRNLSKDAVEQVRKMIGEKFGASYVPDKPNFYASGERAQEAHEAIRPTDATRTPDDLRDVLNDEQFKLYRLIWTRFVACQMPPAVWNVTEADVVAETPDGEAAFKAMGRTLEFDGFLRVAGMPRAGEQVLPPLRQGQPVAPAEVLPTQHFTPPPPRYTEASLVKALEADNIGRPSTYAAIIRTVQDRKYVELVNRAFWPTDLGMVVTDKLVKHFPEVFAVRFTAHMEDQLDRIEETGADWVEVLREFYGPFKQQLDKASEEMVHAKAETQPSEYTCPDCGAPMVYRFGKNGRFLSCSRYPDCKHGCPVDRDGKPVGVEQTDIACPLCSRPTVLRKGRFGPFLSCSKYPECKGVVNLDKSGGVKLPSPPPLQVDLTCEKCGSPLNLRRSKRGPWLSCSKYPKCRGRMGWKTLRDDKRKELELQLLNHEKANPQPTIRTLDGKEVPAGHQPKLTGQDESDT